MSDCSPGSKIFEPCSPRLRLSKEVDSVRQTEAPRERPVVPGCSNGRVQSRASLIAEVAVLVVPLARGIYRGRSLLFRGTAAAQSLSSRGA